MEAMDVQDSYKYLGFLQCKWIETGKVKEQTTQKYLNRLRTVLEIELNSGNKY